MSSRSSTITFSSYETMFSALRRKIPNHLPQSEVENLTKIADVFSRHFSDQSIKKNNIGIESRALLRAMTEPETVNLTDFEITTPIKQVSLEPETLIVLQEKLLPLLLESCSKKS